MSPESNSKGQIGITPFCQLTGDSLQGLVELFTWITNSVLPLPNLLAGIWIVPEGQMMTFVNQAIVQFAPDASPHRAKDHDPDGTAIPIQTENGATALILLNERVLHQLNTDNPFVPEAISTLLEELLHVDLYSIRWARGASLQFRSEDFGCKASLYTLCTSFHDEYAVCRRKNQLLTEHVIFESNKGITSPGYVTYGLSLQSQLENTAFTLGQIAMSAASGAVSVSDAWDGILTEIYRGIFEPLARNAGFVAGNPLGDHPHNNAAESSFFVNHVATYWTQMEEWLDQSVTSGFSKEDEVIHQLVELCEAFLRHIGISVRELEDGTCWVEFNHALFDKLDI